VNRARNLALLATLIVGVAAIVIATGRFAVQNAQPPGVISVVAPPTAAFGQPTASTPIGPFGPIDPAIIPVLLGTPGSKPFAVLPGIQPIGVYLPAVTTPTPSLTLTATATPSSTRTATRTATWTATAAPTSSVTPWPTPSQTPTATPSWTATSSPTPTPTHTLSPTPTSTPLPTPTSPPTPTPFPTDEKIDDYGVLALQNLYMTPNPAQVGDNCAPHGFPVNGVLTQRFGYYHSGIDLGVPLGTPVLATQSGQVIFANWSTIGYGWLVIIQNGRYITYYAHNSAFNVRQYQYVHAGDVISFSGSTGNSNGPHVHYEIRIDDNPVDPLTFDLRHLPAC
jgi:murein DD-endopeptidase MepM/ murein hydrolase activator NlpD